MSLRKSREGGGRINPVGAAAVSLRARADPLNQSVGSDVDSQGFASNKDSLLVKLKQQEKLKEMGQIDHFKYKIEEDGDAA